MKELYPKLILALFLPAIATAQLHIQPNPSTLETDEVYVYNKGEIIFVEDDISLAGGGPGVGEGNLYLRDEGQLIQGASLGANSGSGIVSVYQEGTVNRWDYHYWASPVSDPNSISLGNGTFDLDEPATGGGIYTGIVDEKTSNISLFNPGYDGVPSSGTGRASIAEYWIYTYLNGSSYNDWSQQRRTGDIPAGQGFTMKGVGTALTVSQLYDFRGRPNNGDIAVAISPSNSSLVGNPYPSAMDLSYYLLYNAGANASALNTCEDPTDSFAVLTPKAGVIRGAAYFWESDPSVASHYLEDYVAGYGTFSPGGDCNPSTDMYVEASYSMYDRFGNVISTEGSPSGDIYARRYSPIGQGFFVEADSDDAPGFVEAKNEFRKFIKETSGLSDFRSSLEENKSIDPNSGIEYDERTGYAFIPKMKIKTEINNTYVRVNGVVFNPNMTAGKDVAADAVNISALPTDINFVLPGDNRPYVINVLPFYNEVKLPLLINAASNSTFSMQLSEINFRTPNGGVWLHDKETGDYFDISQSKRNLKIEKGNYTDRFEIVFAQEDVNLDIAEEVKQSFDIFQNNSTAQLHILNPIAANLKEIAVYDISGKQVVVKLNEGNRSEVLIPSSNWSDGVYIVRLITEDNIEFTKKISVYNK